MLTDTFNRVHDYLRISLTDVCNFRCTYCMPDENMEFMPSGKLMQADEIDAIAGAFVKLGVTKIRLTGGEPLVRRDAGEIIRRLSRYPVELTLTTNGSRIDAFIKDLESAGVRSVNVSLDTLKKENFQHITQRNTFDKVWNNIHLLIDRGFHVKVNAVIMKGVNEGEIPAFIEWTREVPIHVRFIEFMPFAGNHWNDATVVTLEEILGIVSGSFSYIKLKDEKHNTAKKYMVPGFAGTFAIISTMSAPFCHNCNRLRLTADGKMKNCLFSKSETNLLEALRNGEDLAERIQTCLMEKKERLGGQLNPDFHRLDPQTLQNRSMIQIGG